MGKSLKFARMCHFQCHVKNEKREIFFASGWKTIKISTTKTKFRVYVDGDQRCSFDTKPDNPIKSIDNVDFHMSDPWYNSADGSVRMFRITTKSGLF